MSESCEKMSIVFKKNSDIFGKTLDFFRKTLDFFLLLCEGSFSPYLDDEISVAKQACYWAVLTVLLRLCCLGKRWSKDKSKSVIGP